MAAAIMTKTFYNLCIFGARYQKKTFWFKSNQCSKKTRDLEKN